MWTSQIRLPIFPRTAKRASSCFARVNRCRVYESERIKRKKCASIAGRKAFLLPTRDQRTWSSAAETHSLLTSAFCASARRLNRADAMLELQFC